MGGFVLHSGNDTIRLFPCKMQFCLDMHVWKDESYANHVSRDSHSLQATLCYSFFEIKALHQIACPAFCLRCPAPC